MKHQTLCALLAAATLVSSEFSAIPLAAKTEFVADEISPAADNETPAETASEVLDQIKTTAPSISEDGASIVLPASSNAAYEVELYGSSNESVIDMEGKIHAPLEDMEVSVMYRVVNKEDETDFALDQKAEASLVIPGRFTPEEADNPRPDVLPGIQEWKGSTGMMNLAEDVHLVVSDPSLQETAETIAEYFEGILGWAPVISTEAARAGDIVLSLDENLSVLGEEGYTLDTADVTAISAPTAKGVLYGGTTLVQILMQNERALPKGMIRDYPAYEVRSCMQDVARFYMPLDYLEEVTKYMAFFKLNEFHVHINDNGGEQAHALRVESKKYPALNSGLNPDEVYSQEDYRDYQKRCAKYGIEIVTEIDTPAHSGFISDYDSSLMLDGYHIDLSNENVLPFIKSLLDEYLDGDDPVFQGSKFNIGTDEYNKTYSEDVRAYMNELIEYVSAKGREVRMWASLGTNGFNGTTPVSNKAVGHYWSASWASYDEMLNMGYPCINNNDGSLYTVPGAGYYHDYIDLKGLYNTWEANYLVPSYHIAKSNPLMLGSEAACWYDAKTGMSQFDVFDRTREQIALMSEKNWTGAKKEGQTADEFLARVDKLAKRSPLSNPARYVESAGETALSYDFETVQDNQVLDASDNHYDGTLTNAVIIEDDQKAGNHALSLDGEGYLSMPFDSIGFPYSISFDLYLEKEQQENAVLFNGKDGVLYANYEGSGKLAFQRKGYTYLFDIEVPTEVWTEILLTCDNSTARLYFNGVFAAEAHYYKVTGASKEASSTFVLPLEEVGSGIYGALDNVEITSHAFSYDEISGLDLVNYSNHALNKPVSVSGLEVYDGRFTAEMANDGNPSTRVSLERKDDAWWQVDLEENVTIDKIVINWSERPNSYQIQISDDGENWTTIHEDLKCVEKSSGVETITLSTPLNARYVRYQQIKQFLYETGQYYSGNFREFEVWAFDTEDNPILSRTAALLESTEETEANRPILRRLALAQDLYALQIENRNLEEMALILKRMSDLCDALEASTIWTDTDTDELEALIRNRENTGIYSDASSQNYLVAYRLGLGSLLDGSLSQQALDSVKDRLKASLEAMEVRPFVSASATGAIYQDNDPSHVLDGKSTTYFWQNGSQTAGDALEFRFRQPVDLYKVAVSNQNCGGDVLIAADVKVSSDGINWTTVGSLKGTEKESVEFDSTPVLMVRIELTESGTKWWKLNEVIFNDGTLCDWYWLDREAAIPADTEGCTVSSIAAWNIALENAKALHEQENVTQADVDAALAALREARAALEQIGDLQPVKDVIARYEQITGEGYTAYSYSHLKEALEQARALLIDPSDAGAVTIARTIEAARTAAENLKELVHGVDTSILDQALDEVLKEQGSRSWNSWSSYQRLIAQAKKYAAGEGTTILAEGVQSYADALERTENTMKEKESSNIALHKPVTCSGLEVDREDVRADKVTDGDLTTRIALHQKNDSWITVDLEEPVLIDRVIFRWFERPKQYKVQVSTDNENWTDVYENNNCADHTKGDDIIDFDSISARYVRYQQIEMQSIGYSGSCYEFEIYNTDTHTYPDELNHQISTAQSLDQTNLSEADQTALDQAISTAQAALEGTEQESMDQAAGRLRDLFLEITLHAYSASLQETLSEAKTLQERKDEFTPASWNALKEAVSNAEEAMRSAISREELDQADENLMTAMTSLARTASKALLKQAVEYAVAAEEAGALEGVNELVVNEFHEALAEAQSILADENADQNTVNASWMRLSRAIQMLEFRTDKEELAALVAQAEALDLDQYADGEEKEAFLAALEQARNVLDDPAALTDVSIRAALDVLTSAMGALQFKADTSMLVWLIQTIEAADLNIYVETAKLEETLEQARTVATDPENQQQVDEMLKTLHSAWMNLRMKPDEALLKELQAVYDQLEALDLSLYTPAVKSRFVTMKKQIRTVLDDPMKDQQQVENVLQQAKVLLKTEPDAAKQDPESSQKDPVQTDPEEITTPDQVQNQISDNAAQKTEQKNSSGTRNSVKTAASLSAGSWATALTAALLALTGIRRRRSRK